MNWPACTCLLSCHRNWRYLEWRGQWACQGNRQMGHINNKRTYRIHLSISASAALISPPKGKCSPLSPTFLTPIRQRCSHNLISTLFKACRIVPVGKNIILTIIDNNRQDNIYSAIIYDAKPHARVHIGSSARKSVSWGSHQVVGQAAILTFESACRLL